MTEPDLRLRAVVPAPPKVVYEALTDPAALRVWLAEHADVDLPGKYEFWGRFTPDGAKPHQRVLHVDERTIRFAWTVGGVESERPAEFRGGAGRHGRCPWRAVDVLVTGDRQPGRLSGRP
jgi:uncharacterized protein YndB with AHSA1/START domain